MQHTVLLAITICYGGKIQRQISKEQEYWGKVQRKTGASFQEPFPSGAFGFEQKIMCSVFPASICVNMCEYMPGKLIKDSVPRFFIGQLSCKHLLHRLPKFKVSKKKA